MIGHNTVRDRSPSPVANGRATKRQRSVTSAFGGLDLESEELSASGQDIANETSDLKIPCTDGHLHSLGIKLSTDVDNSAPEKKKHVITEVDGSHEFVKRSKLSPGDILHAVNGLQVATVEHSHILDRFYQVDEEIIMTVKRKAEDEPDYDDDDDEDGPIEVYTFTEIKIKIITHNGKIVFEEVTVVEKEFIEKSDDGLPLVVYYDKYNTYVYPSNDSSSFLSMSNGKTLQVAPAKIDDKSGQWIMYQYRVIWPFSSVNEIGGDENPSIAVILYNCEYKKCLAVSAGRYQKLVFKKPHLSLDKVKHVDGRIFYRRKWAKDTDRDVFESACFRGYYLAVSGKGIMLMKQSDPDNYVFNTAFSLHTDADQSISNHV
ncbi:uncharacterized protein [Ptychodera flava]|uniref:uncharacterized protein isoform X2 n=1 Tax=Ptychodera flava TaxID=63121 RepID=UPI00396A2125